MNIDVPYKLLTETALPPVRATPGSAGYDLFADTSDDIWIEPGDIVPFRSGVAFEIPPCYAGYIFARSGIATKQGLTLVNGVGLIDWDYRGDVGMPLINLSNEPQLVTAHERIAQIVFAPVVIALLHEKKGVLSWTQRGTGGFGSTGR